MFTWLWRVIRWLKSFFDALTPATKDKIITAALSVLEELFRSYYRAAKHEP